MRQQTLDTRRKLFASMAVLGIVLVIAGFLQFTGRENRVNPYTAPRDPASAEAQPADERPVTRRSAEGRAVFGDTRPAPTAANPRTSAPENSPRQEASGEATRSRTESSKPITTGEDSGIDQLLTRWRSTIMNGDVEGQTELYAGKMERFFTKRNVSHTAVRKEKARMMQMYPNVNRYDISDVDVESNDGNEAVVSFRKEWDMEGGKRFSGAERQRLKLRRIDGDWKIVSEEETKVYWVKRA